MQQPTFTSVLFGGNILNWIRFDGKSTSVSVWNYVINFVADGSNHKKSTDARVSLPISFQRTWKVFPHFFLFFFTLLFIFKKTEMKHVVMELSCLKQWKKRWFSSSCDITKRTAASPLIFRFWRHPFSLAQWQPPPTPPKDVSSFKPH